jgi:hypothetical protein
MYIVVKLTVEGLSYPHGSMDVSKLSCRLQASCDLRDIFQGLPAPLPNLTVCLQSKLDWKVLCLPKGALFE